MATEHESHVCRENARLRAENATLAAAQQSLRDELAILRESLRRREAAQLELEARLKGMEDENHRYAREYSDVEQQNSNLANLYVASYQLHGALEREQVLGAIQEIVGNLVGSEEIGLFKVDGASGGLELVRSAGIDAAVFRRIAPGQGVIGRVAREGRIHLTERDGLAGARPEEAQLTACVPLKLDGRVAAVLALFRLLPQKPALEPLDQELFDLLSNQAAVALYCTCLHEHHAGTCQ